MSSASQTPALPVMWLSWGSLIVLVNKRVDLNVPVSYIKYKCTCLLAVHVVSALKKTSKVNTILKVVIFKHSAILFRCSIICRWPEPWNFKTSHFHILYSFPVWSRISALFFTSSENIWRHFTDSKSCQIIESILKYKNGF
jgi:hypothetical protein